jgi:hypothetical protein
MPPMPDDAKTKDLGTTTAGAGALDVWEEVAKTMGENMMKQKISNKQINDFGGRRFRF